MDLSRALRRLPPPSSHSRKRAILYGTVAALCGATRLAGWLSRLRRARAKFRRTHGARSNGTTSASTLSLRPRSVQSSIHCSSLKTPGNVARGGPPASPWTVDGLCLVRGWGDEASQLALVAGSSSARRGAQGNKGLALFIPHVTLGRGIIAKSRSRVPSTSATVWRDCHIFSAIFSRQIFFISLTTKARDQLRA